MAVVCLQPYLLSRGYPVAVSVSIADNLIQVEKELEAFGAQMPYVVAKTINDTAEDFAGVRKSKTPGEIQHQMKKRFKSPTPFTMNSWFIRYARGRDRQIEARIYNNNKYMNLQIFGGTFTSDDYGKPSEAVVDPTKYTRKNKYGNIPRGSVKRKAATDRYFIGRPKGIKTADAYGLWERQSKGIRKVAHLNRKSRQVKPQLPAGQILDQVARTKFNANFERAMAYYRRKNAMSRLRRYI